MKSLELVLAILVISSLIQVSISWSFGSFFKKIVGDSHTDCLSSYSSFSFNSKSYCDSGKKLIEECDFDEDFDCSDGQATRKKRDLLKDGASILTDMIGVKKDALVKYAENKTMKIIEKTQNYTQKVIDKVSQYKNLFLSSGSFFEIGKAYTQNCNDKVKEYFGTFRTDSKREYLVKIVCNAKADESESNQTKLAMPYISELKTEGCTYIRKSFRLNKLRT